MSTYHCFHWKQEGVEECCICLQSKPEDEAQDFNCTGVVNERFDVQLQLWGDGTDCD